MVPWKKERAWHHSVLLATLRDRESAPSWKAHTAHVSKPWETGKQHPWSLSLLSLLSLLFLFLLLLLFLFLFLFFKKAFKKVFRASWWTLIERSCNVGQTAVLFGRAPPASGWGRWIFFRWIFLRFIIHILWWTGLLVFSWDVPGYPYKACILSPDLVRSAVAQLDANTDSTMQTHLPVTCPCAIGFGWFWWFYLGRGKLHFSNRNKIPDIRSSIMLL